MMGLRYSTSYKQPNISIYSLYEASIPLHHMRRSYNRNTMRVTNPRHEIGQWDLT